MLHITADRLTACAYYNIQCKKYLIIHTMNSVICILTYWVTVLAANPFRLKQDFKILPSSCSFGQKCVFCCP